MKVVIVLIIGLACGYYVGYQDGIERKPSIVARIVGQAGGKARSAVGNDIDATMRQVEDGDKVAPKPGKDESVSPALARPQAAIDLDKLDLAFGPEHATFEDPTPSVLDGKWQDAATKLDLAKAYQEMGDVEGAREILQEVLHEGDDTQKSEAQVLLAKLG